MIKNLYSIRDRLTGFGPLFDAYSNDVAIRQFVMSFKGQQLTVPLEDLDFLLVVLRLMIILMMFRSLI